VTDPQILHWIAPALAVLAIYFLLRATGRNRRRQINWGIGGAGAPMSRFADAAWSLLLFSVALAALNQPPPIPPVVILLVFAGFAILISAAIYDWRHRGKKRSTAV
jgi:hypothetical protein